MKRPAFIAGLGGAAVWPIKRVSVLFALSTEDPEYQARLAAVIQGLHDLGWIEGRNVTLDIHRPTASPDDIRRNVC